MIAHIEGTVIRISEKFIIINVNGIGYKVFATVDTTSACALGEPISLWTYTAVRETALDLYGFMSEEEQSLFELLLDVSGVGPKSALSILSMASIDTLSKAIATGDTSYLNKVSGIGKKTAEKIVIELRDKLKAHNSKDVTGGTLRDEGDVIEALKTLGYSQSEARDALKQVSHIDGTNARIKEALKILGQR